MKKVTFNVGPSSVARFRHNLGASGEAPGTTGCEGQGFLRPHDAALQAAQGSVHVAAMKAAEQHVRQARVAETEQLRKWNIRQAHRHAASVCTYEARLWSLPIVVDACCGTATLVALFHLKHAHAVVIGIDRDKTEDYVRGFIPKKFQSRFHYIKDDVCNTNVARLRKALPAGSRVCDIVHLHSSPPCKSMSTADQFSVHRDEIKPISAQAVADDEALEHTVRFVKAVLKEAPTALVTLENPRNDVFPYLPGVRNRLKSKEWQMLTASYCSNANGLDIGYWPQKDSNFLVFGVPRGFALPMCNSDCDHLIESTARHRVVLCSDRRNHPAQYVIQDATIKGVIPHGLIRRIWRAHIQLLDLRAAAADRLKAGTAATGADMRPGSMDVQAIKRETECSIRQRVAAYGAATEDLGESMQQTATKLCCMARGEMREFRSQVSFATPLGNRYQNCARGCAAGHTESLGTCGQESEGSA